MMRVLALLMLGVTALTSCTGGTGGTSRERLRLDDGALVVVPAEGASSQGREVAARILASQQMPVTPSLLTPILASVSASLPALSGGLGRLHLPLAWVYLAQQERRGAPSCPFIRRGGAQPRHPSRTWALIVDARSGVGYVYAGAGTGFCGPSALPAIRRTTVSESVAFKVERLAPLRFKETYDLPACSRLSESSATIAVAAVDTGPCQAAPARQVMVTYGRLTEKPHARLGLVCYGLSDARLGLPVDCVTAA